MGVGQCCVPLSLLSWITPTQECNQTTQPASMRGRKKSSEGEKHKERRHRRDGNEIPASLALNCSGGTPATTKALQIRLSKQHNNAPLEEEEEESWSNSSLPGRPPLACRATEGTDEDTIGLSSPRTSQFGP